MGQPLTAKDPLNNTTTFTRETQRILDVAEEVSILSTYKGVLGFKVRHLVIVAILVTILLTGLYFFTIQSDACQEAKRFAMTNPEVMSFTGPISEVTLRFWSGFHVTYSGSGGEASFVLSIKGEKEESTLDVRMTRAANSWSVIEAYLTTKNAKGIPIKQKPGISSAHFISRPRAEVGYHQLIA